MNKDAIYKDVICELMDLKADISTVNVTPYVIEPIVNKLISVIIDLMEMDEGRESETCCTCEDCPAMKKVDNFADAIDQGYMISKQIGQPFKVECIESELKTAKKVIESYGIGFHIGIEEAEKMARGGTD